MEEEPTLTEVEVGEVNNSHLNNSNKADMVDSKVGSTVVTRHHLSSSNSTGRLLVSPLDGEYCY